jgi:hypothetical protein
MRKNKLKNSSTNNSKKKRKFFIPLLAIFLGVYLIFSSFHIATRPTPLSNTTPAIGKKRLSKQELDEFFKRYVRPALDRFQKNNEEAVNRAVQRISTNFDEFKGKIPEFIDDITSLKTRINILSKLGKDTFEKLVGDSYDANYVEEYIETKFNKYIFSDYDLESLIKDNLKQFHDDILANQNRLHADIITAWKKAGFDFYSNLNIDKIVSDARNYVLSVSKNSAIDSVTVGIASEIGGWILGNIAEKITEKIILKHLFEEIGIQFTETVAISASVSTAAKSASAAQYLFAGATAGSFFGPVGEVGGVICGVVVGTVVDWWMTDKLKEKLEKELNEMILKVEDSILLGTDDSPGLKDIFINTIEIINKAEEKALLSNIKGGC